MWDYIRAYQPDQRHTASSVANILTDPLENVKPLPATAATTAPITQQSNDFLDTLHRYRNLSAHEAAVVGSGGGLNEAVAQIELNADIPSFEILSRDMDVPDLVSCSQNLIRSVSNTLQELERTSSLPPSASNQAPEPEKCAPPKSSCNLLQQSLAPQKQLPPPPPPIMLPLIPERSIRRWAAEIVVAIQHLHAIDIVCMDLRPDNILLGPGGQVLLTYFYRRPASSRNLCLAAIDGMYVAPERPLSNASDWWSFGVLLFEMLTGSRFDACHAAGWASYYELQYPDGLENELSADAKDLLQEVWRVLFCVRFH